MEFPTALVLNAIIAGLLLGGFYAAVSVGISISFGMLDVVNIAHPAFIILGSYIAYIVNDRLGVDPILVSVVVSPLFFALGLGLYRIYYLCFEKRGQESLRGLAFFFGILFITEVALVLIFGVDYRMVQTTYSETTFRLGPVDFPMRLVVPFLVSVTMVIGVQLFLTHTFFGRAVLAVAQDPLALRLMGVNPIRVKSLAFALSIATAGVAGAFMIVIQPVQPAIGREYIGLVFAVCVLGGMGSIWGTLLGALVLGLAESFTSTFMGPSWAPAVSFGLLLATLALAVVLFTFVINWDYVGGARGAYIILPRQVPFGLPRYVHLLYAAMVLMAALAVAVARSIETSVIGRGLAAVRDDEMAAECAGVPTLRLKIFSATVSGALMGMAGTT